MRSTVIVLVLIGMLGITCAALAQDAKPAIEVHGYMLNRFYSAPSANAEFRMERLSLSVGAALPEESKAYAEVYYHPWADSSSGVYLESAYYDRGIEPGRIRVGKGRLLTFGMTPSYPNRKTTNYGIVGETFTQDRIQGIQYYVQKGALDAGISLHQAYRLGVRQVGDISGDRNRQGITANTVPHLTFRDLPGSTSRKVELSARLGGKWASGWKAGVSGTFSTLDPADVTNLTTASATNSLSPGGAPALLAAVEDDDINIYAFDAQYKSPSGFVLQGEWYDGNIADLDVTAWDVLFGYEPAAGWKYYLRYSKKDVDGGNIANPLAWDLTQTSISLVQPLSKTVWLQYEYEINEEKPGSVSNNLFFIELFSGF